MQHGLKLGDLLHDQIFGNFKIEEENGYKNAESLALDLGKFNSISEFATQASKTLDRLDILIENAALASTSTSDPGWLGIYASD
ncbi:hypothetical protein BT96DRAFT_987645 [Gymnopus androsaceus JB14]|uniref:Uncharacterized protein n=1 Tax=Gymnopus androsaceus JB14 TaxID=1447944 RepID=A0A6A4I671_9AGAR|nr:hypothetical protein BT96DRAFT_987645 [Gymnopus androsaceus JB14]